MRLPLWPLIIGSFLSCATPQKPEEEKELVKDRTVSVSLEGRLMEAENTVHLLRGIAKHPDLALLTDAEKLEQTVYEQLQHLEHTSYSHPDRLNYSLEGVVYETPMPLEVLTLPQLQRIYLLLESLQENGFREAILKELRLDLEDPQTDEGFLATERGGLIRFKEEKLVVHPIPSVDSYTTEEEATTIAFYRLHDTNSLYRMPEGVAEETPHLFSYHNHATKQDNTAAVGPSFFLTYTSPFFFGERKGDIPFMKREITRNGQTHQLVFTPIGEDTFNVGYFGGNEGTQPVVLSLGNWQVTD